MSDAREKIKAAAEAGQTNHRPPVTEAGKKMRQEYIDELREELRADGRPVTEEWLVDAARDFNWDTGEQEYRLLRQRAIKRAEAEKRDYIEVLGEEMDAAYVAGKI